MNKKEQTEQLKILSKGIKEWLKNGCNGDCYSGCTGCDRVNDIDDFIDRLLKD